PGRPCSPLSPSLPSLPLVPGSPFSPRNSSFCSGVKSSNVIDLPSIPSLPSLPGSPRNSSFCSGVKSSNVRDLPSTPSLPSLPSTPTTLIKSFMSCSVTMCPVTKRCNNSSFVAIKYYLLSNNEVFTNFSFPDRTGILRECLLEPHHEELLI